MREFLCSSGPKVKVPPLSLPVPNSLLIRWNNEIWSHKFKQTKSSQLVGVECSKQIYEGRRGTAQHLIALTSVCGLDPIVLIRFSFYCRILKRRKERISPSL